MMFENAEIEYSEAEIDCQLLRESERLQRAVQKGEMPSRLPETWGNTLFGTCFHTRSGGLS
jgi:hypothetical protein